MELPFAGARMLRDLLAQEGGKAGRLHVATLMKRMGVEVPISQAEQLETGAWPQDLPLSAAKAGRHPARAKSGRWTSPIF